MTIDITADRAIIDAATEGPWEWYGNSKTKDVCLATTHSGRRFVMDFVRWGMRGAQPRFQMTVDGEPGRGIMRELGDLAKEEHPLGPCHEVSYRRQFVGIGHPDARVIAAARQGWPAALDECERLRALLAVACGWFDEMAAVEVLRDRGASASTIRSWADTLRTDGGISK